MICGGGADAEQNVSESELTWIQKMRLRPPLTSTSAFRILSISSGVRRKISWVGFHPVAYVGQLYLMSAVCPANSVFRASASFAQKS